jgi:3-deoxy-D-manno-octulosonic-acid transferase
MTAGPHDRRYRLAAYRSLPITFVRRVIVGRDRYWRRYFWNRWGHVGRSLERALRLPAEAGGKTGARPVLWLDALSGGEVTQSVTFCRELRAALPGWTIVFSTNNKYSFDFASSHLAVDAVFDTPWDLPGPVRRAIRRIRPAAFVCIHNIFCPVLIQEAHRAGVTTVVVSGSMGKDYALHPIYQRTSELSPYADLDWIGAWSPEDVEGFVAAGADPARVRVTGNMKFDLEFLRLSDRERRELASSLQLAEDEPVLLAVSIHPGEEEVVGRAYLRARETAPNLRLMIAPRYSFDIETMTATLGRLGLSSVRRTALARATLAPGAAIVVDTFGELSRLQAIAAVVFLGGTMYCRNGIGLGQNPIEALAHRKPLFFGPFMNLWRVITDELKAAWPAVEVASADDLAAGVLAVLAGDPVAAAVMRRTDAILARHAGDVRRNVDLVCQALGHAGFATAAASH